MPATFSRGFGPIPAATVTAAEKRLGVELPPDYRRFLLTTNGGRPSPVGRPGPPGVAVPGCGDVVLDVLFGVHRKRRSLDLEREQARARESGPLPSGVLAIGRDAGGNPLVLDTNGGGVVYLDRAGVFPGTEPTGHGHLVAESFTTFLHAIRELPRPYQGVQFADSLSLVTAAMIRKTEKQLGVVFPDDYRAFLKAINGGIPSPSEFAMAKPGRPGERIVIDFLYGVGYDRERYDLLHEQEQIAERTDSLPDGFVTIGHDPGAAPYFIGTKGETAGAISFYDPDGFLDPKKESKLYVAARSFSDLLRRLAAG